MMREKDDKMVPVCFAAQKTGFSERWIRELARRGIVEKENPGVRQTRVSLASVQSYRQREE
jgi:hypothetical protein